MAIYINGDEFLNLLSVAVHEDGYICLHMATVTAALNAVKSVEIENDGDFITNEERIQNRLKGNEK